MLERGADEFTAAGLGPSIYIVICPSNFGKLRLPFAGQISLLCPPSACVKQQALPERAARGRFLFSAIFSDENKFVIFTGILPKQIGLA